MENPFIYGESVSEPSFCNRKKEIAELLQDMEEGQNVIIFSPRRYGKTSLIQTILKRAERKGLICIYVDLYSALTESDFVNLLAKSTAKAIRGTAEKVLGWFRDNLLKIRPKIVLDDDGSPSFTFDFDNKEAGAVPHVENLLTSVYKYLIKSNKKGVTVFDEFQQINQFPTDKLERQLRTIIQNHRHISYIFMGSRKHLIYKMFSSPAKPFYRSAKHFPLYKIPRPEFLPFILERFEESGKKIDKKTAEEILTISECHPYYTQLICHVMWEKIGGAGHISIKDVIKKVLARENSAFQNILDNITIMQRQALVAIANKNKEDKLFSVDFLSRFGFSSASALQKTLKILLAKDLLDKEDGDWNIPDVLFKLWLRESKR